MAKFSVSLLGLFALALLCVYYPSCCSSFMGITSIVDDWNHEAKVGGRMEVQDVKHNKEVQKLGRFSVEEYNRMKRDEDGSGNGMLRFVEVVEAEIQVVSGIKYYLKVDAQLNGSPKRYEAVVVVKPWLHSKHLLTFAPPTYQANNLGY